VCSRRLRASCLLARRIVIDVDIAMFTGLVLLCFCAVRNATRQTALSALDVRGGGIRRSHKRSGAVFLPAVVFLVYLASQKGWAILDE